MKGQLLGLGATQVIATTAVIAIIAVFAGKYWGEAVATGRALALSSTAIAIQIMQDRGMMSNATGKSGFSVLLFQDVAVIAMIALLPALALPGGGEHIVEAGHGPAEATGPSGWILAVSIFGVFGGMILVV